MFNQLGNGESPSDCYEILPCMTKRNSDYLHSEDGGATVFWRRNTASAHTLLAVDEGRTAQFNGATISPYRMFQHYP